MTMGFLPSIAWERGCAYQGDGATVGEQVVFFPGHDPVVSWRLLEDSLILC